MEHLAVPTVHLNGTSGTELKDGYMRANAAFSDALETLRGCAPNRRDYYTGADSDVRWRRAVSQHEDRVSRVKEVVQEIEYLLIAVHAQIEG